MTGCSQRLRTHTWARAYPALACSCAAMRRDVTAFLEGVGLDGDVVDVARTVVGELAVNAITHHQVVQGELVLVNGRVTEAPHGARVTITVTDGGVGCIAVPRHDTGRLDEHGRGLLLLSGIGVQLCGERCAEGYRVEAQFLTDSVVRERELQRDRTMRDSAADATLGKR